MLTIEPTGAILGATVHGVDAAQPISDRDFGRLLAALSQYGVLRLPDQHMDEDAVRRFSRLFGDIQGPSSGPMTEEQRRRRPPVVHPLFLRHPITGRKVLYCNPGYSIRINELSEAESQAMLQFFYDHQLQDRFRYTHHWTENDLLVWDHIGTI